MGRWAKIIKIIKIKEVQWCMGKNPSVTSNCKIVCQ